MGDEPDGSAMDAAAAAVAPGEDVVLFGSLPPSLPSSFTDEELEHHLQSLLGQFGQIVSTKASRDKKLRPYCFVQFRGPVQDELFSQPHYLGGRSLRIERSRVKSSELLAPQPPTVSPEEWAFFSNYAAPVYPMVLAGYSLYVSGLANRGLDRSVLFQRFKRFGFVLSVDLWYGREGDFGAMACIYYSTYDAVERAIESNEGALWLGGKISCSRTIRPEQIAGLVTTSPLPLRGTHAPDWYTWYPPQAHYERGLQGEFVPRM